DVANLGHQMFGELALRAREIERSDVALAASPGGAFGLAPVLHEAIEAGPQERAEPRLHRIVGLDVALLERGGEERLHGIFGIFGRETPVQAEIVIARTPVPLRQIAERRAPDLGVGAPDTLQHRTVRRGERQHAARVTHLTLTSPRGRTES